MEINQIIVEAENHLKSLLESRPVSNLNIPNLSGVYIARSGDKIIYVGTAKNLSTRISRNHLGTQINNSVLQRKVSKEFNIPANEIANHIKQKFLFSYVVIPDYDIRQLVESLAIAYFRKNGNSLLNHKN